MKLAAQFTRFGKTKVNGICIMHHLLLLSNGIDVYGKEGPRQVVMLPNCTTPTTGAIALYLSLVLLGIKLSIVLVNKKKKKNALYMHNKYTKSFFFFFRSYTKSLFINILEFNFQCLFQSSQTLVFVYISVHVWLTLVYKCFSKKKKRKKKLAYKPIYKYFTTKCFKGMY